jgi:hypothetical protein
MHNRSLLTLYGLAWFPYACHWKQQTSIEASQCLSGKRILVHGDSQTRTLYNYMATTFCGIENAAVKGFLDTKCVNGSDKPPSAGPAASVSSLSCPGLQSCFRPEVYGAWNLSEITKVDVFLVNFGQHLATGGLPVSGYTKKVTEFARHLLDEYGSVSRKPGQHTAVWMETQPFPISTNNGIIIGHRCKRTSQRTRLYNAAAAHAIRPLASVPPGFTSTIKYLETFDMLSAILDASTDNAHLVGFTPALNALAQMVLAAVCPA